MSTPSSEPPPLRIGNQERDAATAALDTHLEAGRLDADEYGERYAKAAMARTSEDLNVLFLDLPAPHPVCAPLVPRAGVSLTKGTPRGQGWQPRVPTSPLGRLAAALVLVAAVGIVVPLLAVGAILWFVVIPVLRGHGTRRHHHRSWGGPAWR